MDRSRYIPALSFRWLTPVYDAVLRWGMREEVFKRQLIQRADIHAGQHILDLGCGTGTLTVMLKLSAPEAEITGLDGDAEVLSIAKSKAAQGGVNIQWQYGMAYKLPYADRSFDTVVSSLVIHHLVRADKARTFREVHRILRPGGAFHIVDFGHPFSALTRLEAATLRNLEEAADNFDGRIVGMLKEAGFETVSEDERMNTIFGPIWFYQAVKGTVSDPGTPV